MSVAEVIRIKPDIADAIRSELAEYNDLSIDDIHRRQQWTWRRMIDAARDMSELETQMCEIHETLDPAWEEAYVRSVVGQEKRINAKFHESVANMACRDQLTMIAGLEAQHRIAKRWWSTLHDIREDLRTHESTARTMGAA